MKIYPARKPTSNLQDRTGKPLLWLFALIFFNSVLASELQNHDEIHQAVKDFAGNVTIQEVDPRLRLEACAENLSVRYPFSTETTVEVKCTADKGWKIFLTVEKANNSFIPQNHNEIYDQVLRFAGDVRIEKISPHLIYEKCISGIRISYPFKDHKTVKAECFQPSQWEVFIPISHPEKNSAQIPPAMGVIATRALLRGIPIIASDIELKAFPDNRLKSGHVKSLSYPIGMEPSQTIPKGALISINMLRPPVLVHKGDAVSIIFERNGISVTNEGIALEDGGLREKIKIQLPDTKKILSAIIQSPGVVKIP